MPQPSIHPAKLHERRERVFLVLAGLFLGMLAMLNILGISRFICLASWGPPEGGAAAATGAAVDWVWRWGKPNSISNVNFALAVGVLPYPLTFLCTDIISEFYGRKRANFVVWVGLLLNLWVMFILWVGGMLPGFDALNPATHMPPRPEWDSAVHAFRETGWTFFQVRNLAFGAVTASMIAYLAAQFCDVYVFHFWKRVTRGKHLWLRNNGSTMVSQMVDTVAVILITHFYAHALPINLDRSIWPQLGLFIITGYAFKFVAALLDTPFFYGAVYLMTGYLQIDPTVEHTADREEVVMVPAGGS